tara:strand:+ start:109 stop:318 length:210 start_codon:yes stop_codon:yes gene_type:complete
MSTYTKIENELITKIEKILKDFEDFKRPCVNNNGDIIIKKKFKRERNNASILVNIFKEIIKNDVKKNRV